MASSPSVPSVAVPEKGERFETYAHAKEVLFDYIEVFPPSRLAAESHLGYVVGYPSCVLACSPWYRVIKRCRLFNLQALRTSDVRCRALPESTVSLLVECCKPHLRDSIASRSVPTFSRWYAKCSTRLSVGAAPLSDSTASLSDTENWLALGTGALLLMVGASQRSAYGACLAVASGPLLYRGITGRWPGILDNRVRGNTKTALAGERGMHVRESIRLERPVADVYGFWRRLEDLPRFMTHLDRVTEMSPRQSHWVAAGPAGLTVEWDAEIINEIENEILAWRSLPGSDVVTAGSVNFGAVRGGRSTQVHVHLQYAPPAGKAGALVATLFGREPSQTIREDLRHFKQLLEAGEIPRASATR